MGACQCSGDDKNDLPNVSKMAMSKYSSTGDSYNPTPAVQEPLTRSKMLADSMILTNMQKVSTGMDTRIKSKNVKSRLPNMPPTQASRSRNVLSPEGQMYIKQLSAQYVGQIQSSKPNGFGKLYFDNEDYLEGTFVDGRCEGKGRYIKADGTYYEGDLKNNVADGYGLYVGKKGFKYEGQWKNNMPNGSGQATYPDGTRYVGQFFNNKRHGRGTLYDGGNIYRGEFKQNAFDGRLRFEGDNGEVYDGEWKNNLKNGMGSYDWPDGSHYEGEYRNGKREGQGEMRYPTGQIYSGEWLNGKKHGQGSIKSESRNFSGVWENGELKKVNQ